MTTKDNINYGKRIIAIVLAYTIAGILTSYFLTRHTCGPRGIDCHNQTILELIKQQEFWLVAAFWPPALIFMLLVALLYLGS